MHAIIHPADVQDRDGGGLVMATLFGLYPFLLKIYADGGSRSSVPESGESRHRPPQCRDRQTVGSGERFRGSAEALGGRTNIRVAQQVPPPRQRLGVPQPESSRLRVARVHPDHGTKIRQGNGMIPDRL